MYGYKNLTWRVRAKVLVSIIFLAVILVVAGIIFVKTGVFKTEQYVAIAVGLIAGVTAIGVIFLQIRLSIRRKLEADAIIDLQKAMNQFAKVGATAVTFHSDFVAKPMRLPANFWQDKAYEKYDKVANQVNEIRKGFGAFYVALETHEIAIIHLEHYYRYLTLRVGDFIDKIEQDNSQFLQSIGTPNFDENAYKLAVKNAFGDTMKEWAIISSFLMDFRKLLQTDLLGEVFRRKLLPRKPYDGSSILQQVATKERVKEMVETRDAEFRR